jgi:hypothetical protein
MSGLTTACLRTRVVYFASGPGEAPVMGFGGSICLCAEIGVLRISADAMVAPY